MGDYMSDAKRALPITEGRRRDLGVFYELLSVLEQKIGGARLLFECNGRMVWPRRGVYFFREIGEERQDRKTLRIVRVGTHALKPGSRTSLWTRLSQHKGQTLSGGGNHRGSIFRLLVGTSLIHMNGHACPTWGQGSHASRDVRSGESDIECAVSAVIGRMPFLWLPVEDEPGPQSLRGYIERNAIALLSNYARSSFDSQSEGWLGRFCDRERVRASGLWNSNHVEELHDPAFLLVLERLIHQMEPPE